MTYKVEYHEIEWECECCGSGYHQKVVLMDGNQVISTWSINEQFGGTLSKEHLPFPNDEQYTDAKSFAYGILEGLRIFDENAFMEMHN